MNRFPGMVLTEERAAAYIREGVWKDGTWLDVFEYNAKVYGNVTHSDESRTLSYRELWQECTSVAAALVNFGIKKGDKVAIQLPTSLDFVVALFSIARIGAVAVVLQADLGRQALADSITQSEASLLIVADQYAPLHLDHMSDEGVGQQASSLKRLIVRGKQENLPPDTLWFEQLRDAKRELTADAADLNRPGPLDPFMMVFTAGTTGAPKGIVHLHANTLWSARTYAGLYGLQPGDGMLDLAPVYHLTGLLVGVMMPMVTSGRMLFMSRFSARRALQWVEEDKPRCLVGAPPHLIHLAGSPELTQSDTSSVEFFFYAGAPVPSSILSQLQADTGWTVGGLFGWSEGFLSCATRKGDPIEAICTTVGQPIPGVEIRLIDRLGNPVEPGVAGEMISRGPSFAAGYYNNPQAAGRKWDADGWFHSGDVLRQDENGRFVYAGRVDHIINRGGTKIDPEVVEDALVVHPDVDRAAVFGVPDKTLGQRTVAAVILREGTAEMSMDEVRGFLQSQGMAKFQLPDKLVFLGYSSDNQVDKLGRKELRALYESQVNE